MSLKNRIKPKLLRDIKTEALLVFIRTTLEQNFYDIENMFGYSFILGNDEDNKLIHIILKELLINLQSTVVSSIYLKNLIENAKERPPFHYFGEGLTVGEHHLLGELPLPLGKLLLQYAVKVFTIWGKGRYNIG